MTHLPDISVIVPCYNSELTIPDLVSRIELTLSTAGMSFDIVLVEDHSSDRTWEVICELARRRPGVRGFRLMRNYGQHNALLCGIRAARFEILVTVDDDLQHPPELIPEFLRRWEKARFTSRTNTRRSVADSSSSGRRCRQTHADATSGAGKKHSGGILNQSRGS